MTMLYNFETCNCALSYVALNDQKKYSNCTVSFSKYITNTLPSSLPSILNSLLDKDQTLLLTQVIQCRILIRPGYFINQFQIQDKT